jgi:hypothetical protein
VLETVLNSSFVQFKINPAGIGTQAAQSTNLTNMIPNGILDIIKYIALSLTNSQACPCFQL